MTRLYLQAAILLLRQQQWPQPPWPQPKRRNKGWQESLGLSLRSLYQLKSPFIKTRETSFFFFPNLLTNAKLDERHISKSYIGRSTKKLFFLFLAILSSLRWYFYLNNPSNNLLKLEKKCVFRLWKYEMRIFKCHHHHLLKLQKSTLTQQPFPISSLAFKKNILLKIILKNLLRLPDYHQSVIFMYLKY